MKIDTEIFGESQGEQATMKGKCNWKKKITLKMSQGT